MTTITSKIDAITFIPDDRRTPILPAPRSVKIELTARCNFSCSFCARGDRMRDQRDMDRDLYRTIIADLRRAGVEELGLFYLGESFLLKWLPDAIAEAKEIGFPYVFLTTNGSMATREKTRACFGAGLDSMKFSFNYADRAQFVTTTGVKDSLWDTVRHNIVDARVERDCHERIHGHRCGLYASYIRYDGDQASRMVPNIEWLESIVDEVYALPLYNQAGICRKREETAGWRPIAGTTGRADNPVPPLPCWAIFQEGHVSWDGHLSACCFDHDYRFSMGILDGSNFMTEWNSDKFQTLRQAHLTKDVSGTVCEDCVAWQ